MATGNGKERKVQRELPVDLTDAEKLKLGEEMADLEIENEVLKTQRQALNAKILEKDKARRKIAHAIETGTEERMVTCRIVEDFAKNVLHFVREDTGAEVDTEPMTAEDRQVDVFGGDEEPSERESKRWQKSGKKNNKSARKTANA